jgi:AraC family transcriptional regulator, regulatory protein of adaptative response / DNA-3-methyladenine glycosylase II
MRMTDAQMYARLLAGDPTYNGRFFTGVLTTGIYCLPSCKARKPKQENVRFFPTCEAARAAGLRPCKKCHPDDFARGSDPLLETVEQLVAELRDNPAAFPDVPAVVRRCGFGTTRVFELLRQHYHSTPAELLVRARVDAAKKLLLAAKADRSLLDVAAAVGFESQSVFHENFRRLNGLTPGAYRDLLGSRTFEVALPQDYPLANLLRILGRDPHSLTDRLNGDEYVTSFFGPSGPGLLQIEFERGYVACRVTGASAVEAHSIVVGILGLDQPAEAFSKLAERSGLKRLVAGRRQLRVPQTVSVYDGLVWSIIGQQINLPFAFQLRRSLVEKTGTRLEHDIYALPAPADVARLSPEELLPLKFSKQKAAYLVGISREIDSGKLDLRQLTRQSATRVERTLLAQHGFGPWSVNYVMMRSLGFADCVPLGDTGVTSGLKKLFNLDTRPDADATRRLMLPFAPYRSLATAHLWQLNHEPL